MEQIRSFIAIELPEEIKTSLEQVQQILKSGDPGCAKWVDPAGMHLTLKFLGNVGEDTVDYILKSMEEACKGISSFNLELKNLGAFPNLRRVQVVWVGMMGNLDKLSSLQKNLETSLSPLGFTPGKPPLYASFDFSQSYEKLHSLWQRQALGELIPEPNLHQISRFRLIPSA